MASAATETTPLVPASSPSKPPKKLVRNVTFSPDPAIIHIGGSTDTTSPATQQSQPSVQFSNVPNAPANPPMLSALNNKLRRRNSAGAPLSTAPGVPGSKIGPQRTTKNVQKLKLLPNLDFGEEGPDEESGRDVYAQYTRIKDPTARRDAARLGKADRDLLPRVTAYCTANKYQMEKLMSFLKGRGKTKGASPKRFDECIYTPYNYTGRRERSVERRLEVQSSSLHTIERRRSDSYIEVDDNLHHPRDELIDLHTEGGLTTISNGEDDVGHAEDPAVLERRLEETIEPNPDFDIQVHIPEVFLFDYGVVVIWGMSMQHEQRFLKELAKFESEKLSADNVETECFNFYYTREYQARIYNDFITLREKNNYMTKLAISHALAQSVKTSLFEELVDHTIETCKDVPTQIALTGKIALTSKEINMQIGELFILRINIHLNGSVLDTPELFWVEPQLEPVYDAVRNYLEMDQRVNLLTDRLDVIADLLAVLKDQLSHGHGEMLEWIVIVLIAAEIMVAVINIIVDVWAGGD